MNAIQRLHIMLTAYCEKEFLYDTIKKKMEEYESNPCEKTEAILKMMMMAFVMKDAVGEDPTDTLNSIERTQAVYELVNPSKS